MKDSQVIVKEGLNNTELVQVEVNLVPISQMGRKQWTRKRYLYSFFAESDADAEERVKSFITHDLKESIRKGLSNDQVYYRDFHKERIFEVTLFARDAEAIVMSPARMRDHRYDWRRSGYTDLSDGYGWGRGERFPRDQKPVCPQARTGE